MKYYQSFVFGFLAIFLFGLFSAPAAYAFAGNSEQEHRSVLVSFSEHPDTKAHNQVAALGGKVTTSYDNFPVLAVTLPEQAITALANNPIVERIETNYPAWAAGYSGNNEIENAWGLTHTGADETISDGYLGEAIKVAVVDSGVDYTHPNLESNFGETLGFNAFTGQEDPADKYGHGTHVAGTVGAALDGLGVAGVAPAVHLYGVKVLDDNGYGSHESIVRGLDWIISYNNNADEPIRITNNSYGSSGSTTVLQTAFNELDTQGVINIAAAGNSGNPGGNNDTVIYPAKYDTVMAVSAVDSNNQRPNWSSTGSDVEITAPGVSVLSAWIGGISYANPQPVLLENDTGETAWYKEGSGTSMAAPHVAGAAAVALGINPSLDAGEVRAILNETAEDVGLNARQQGNGLLRVDRVAQESLERQPVATGSLAGQVTDSGGGVVVDADITINGLSTVTNESGEYTVSHVPVGEQEVSINAYGYRTKTATVEITEDDTTMQNFILEALPVHVLTGSVYDEQNQPIEGALVTILETQESARTDGSGNYSFAEVMEGAYTLEVRADGFETTQKSIDVNGDTGNFDFTLNEAAAGSSVTVSELTLEGRGGRTSDRHLDISATLLDDNGDAVSNAVVELKLTNGYSNWSFSGSTNSEGVVNFTLTNAPNGCYEATIEHIDANELSWDQNSPSHNTFCK